MHFEPSEWFGFKKRVKHNMIFTKTVNGQTITKRVYARFNWWALLFNWFYALFSPRCQTPFFALKAAVPFLAMVLINMITQTFFNQDVYMVVGLITAIWYGFMFETWFRNQLVANGFKPQTTE
ncbi:hypothetical protein [Lactiplantibacillus modestisalitolerans]|uniref:Integral membrane protein n=1 Tax=Lactiplantibacillus modestisalitolerans TaxID=1457219 RepID=A0ABV5WSL6_9LACO|nr:hypothetical protein [Lactiplantibacillus modestisalitolerans]